MNFSHCLTDHVWYNENKDIKGKEWDISMGKYFNVNGDCQPDLHYMVDISDRLQQIERMVDDGQYFTINRARQYGKTTTLIALGELLQKKYLVLSLDFQMLSYTDFATEQNFVHVFCRELLDCTEDIVPSIRSNLKSIMENTRATTTLSELFKILSEWCGLSERKLVLIIDEVDSATNNQVFLDFLAQLRGYYIKRRNLPTFQSVILAGVYDVRNLKGKFVPENQHKVNSPWNIAADFLVDMSFSEKDIAGMLCEYETDYSTGMNIDQMANLLVQYTSGYPFLVSRICKLIDERISESAQFPSKQDAWTKDGFLEAVKLLLNEKNPLFGSLVAKLTEYPDLREMIYSLLFQGTSIIYHPLNPAIEVGEMLGFVRNDNGSVIIANRIFETYLYNLFLSEDSTDNGMYGLAVRDKNQFICDGHLNMRLILEKFVLYFDDLYGDQGAQFYEDDGRRFFLLFLRPIINGTGNYYVEAQTRNKERTDIIIDYRGEQFIIELKIWRGNAYNTRGERQLTDYLDHYHADTGYMLSFNFNQNKDIGVKEIRCENKTIIEAVV